MTRRPRATEEPEEELEIEEKFAKIYRFGGEVKTFEVSDYGTIGEAIEGAGVEVRDGDTVRLNGEVCDKYDELEIEDGDVISIVPGVKGA
jgi:molybdopterin converting factor small subunit